MFVLIGRSAISFECLFDIYLFVPLHSMPLNLCYLRNVSVTKFIWCCNVIEFSRTIKTKVVAEATKS